MKPDHTKSGDRRFLWRLLTCICLGLLAGCSPKQPKTAVPITVRCEYAAPLTQASMDARSGYIGHVRGGNEIDLSFKIGGILARIGQDSGKDWQEGSEVVEGQVLAQLVQTDLIALTNAAYAKWELDTKLLERSVNLFEKGAVSTNELDIIKAAKVTSEASLAQAVQALKDSVLKAPFSGYIAARLANSGQTVSSGSTVLRLSDIREMKVEVGVPDTIVSQITPNQLVPLRISALEWLTYTGRVDEVGVAAKEGARLFKVALMVDNPGGRIKAGMTAKVFLDNPPARRQGVLAPLSALLSHSASKTGNDLAVFVVENGVSRERRIETDDIFRSSILVTRGLATNDLVVVAGASNLYDGAPVNVIMSDKSY